MFAESDDGAQRAALIYSFMGSCKIHNVESYAWLKDVLTRIPDQSIHKLEEILPGYLPEKLKENLITRPPIRKSPRVCQTEGLHIFCAFCIRSADKKVILQVMH